jgi:hypothetical protein
MAKEPASEGELAKRANKKAERKRLAFSASKAEKGKTMFTTPSGGAGTQPLKTTLG